eukprot:TRINITY_DN10546_c1_g1_i1.p1 TRINITY_DN10546_c1_g1~~TRINITY_DN10546_c1_g1_i1.p1  ORF type:complete len:442 (+),score=66.96 TRINITY_DN10546_c1_g1_i1:38-1327(+)
MATIGRSVEPLPVSAPGVARTLLPLHWRRRQALPDMSDQFPRACQQRKEHNSGIKVEDGLPRAQRQGRHVIPDITTEAALLAAEVRRRLRRGSRDVTLADAGPFDARRAVKRRLGCSSEIAGIVLDRARLFLRVTGVRSRPSVRNPRHIRYIAAGSCAPRVRSSSRFPSKSTSPAPLKRLRKVCLPDRSVSTWGPAPAISARQDLSGEDAVRQCKRQRVLGPVPGNETCSPEAVAEEAAAVGPQHQLLLPLADSTDDLSRKRTGRRQAAGVVAANESVPGWMARLVLLLGGESADARPLACTCRYVARRLFWDSVQLSAELRPATRDLGSVSIWGDVEERTLQTIRRIASLLLALAPLRLGGSPAAPDAASPDTSTALGSSASTLWIAEVQNDLTSARVRRMSRLLRRMASRAGSLARRLLPRPSAVVG